MNTDLIALIDGDVICYSAGFASDKCAKDIGEAQQPLSFCLHGVNKMVAAITRDAGCTDSQVFLSHPVNHRLAVFPEYKANRDPAHKPSWYKEIKEHLLKNHSAVFSDEGDEADDALGIALTENPYSSVLCSVDKDLDMIPGMHYNWSKKRKHFGVYEVDEVSANQFFYGQLLTGDSTDNIPGMFKKLGKKATSKYLDPLNKMSDTAEMYEYVCSVYKDITFVKMIGQLLWIKRESSNWVPPTSPLIPTFLSFSSPFLRTRAV